MARPKASGNARGLACVFEHNPFKPLTRWAVSSCVFDRDAVLLTMRRTVAAFTRAGATVEDRRYYLFTPFEGRPAAVGERLLRRVPLGGQYVVAGSPGNGGEGRITNPELEVETGSHAASRGVDRRP
jgi:hypothetical protein